MTTAVKISIIGAGSARFSLDLVKDLCLTESLWGSTVSFMDIDRSRLDMVHKLASRYSKELSADLIFEETTNMRSSLGDADFVINIAYVKGHDYAKAIREVTAKHGYYHYHGPGGTGRCPGEESALSNFYQFQLMLDLARQMEEVCPDAYLIQTGNPVFDCCTIASRETSIKVCGLCHGHYGYREIASTIGIDPSRVVYQAPGLNHCIWLTQFMYDGRSAYPLVDEWINTKAEEYWRTHIASRTHDIQMSRAAVHQYRMYGLFPIGDTVRSGGWWYHTDIQTKKRWFGEPWGGPDTELARLSYVKDLSSRMGDMRRITADQSCKVTEVFTPNKSREQHVPLIDSLVNDHGNQFQVNVPNHGTLEGLPDDVVVEVPAVVNRRGIRTVHVGRLPNKIMLQRILPRWLAMERNLLAFRTGDRSILLWEVLEDHQTRSYGEAEAVLSDLLAMSDSAEVTAHYR